jgi:hypothetical protein
MTHQPKCAFTFTLGYNESPTYMYNYKGFQIRDITEAKHSIDLSGLEDGFVQTEEGFVPIV